MWKACLNSEITFWVLLVADVVLVVFMLYGFFLYVKAGIEYRKEKAERLEYMKWLETNKK